MEFIKYFALWACVLIISLTACSKTPSTNEPDANMIYTQVAETVQAQLSKSGNIKPTETFSPIIDTTQPGIPTLPPVPEITDIPSAGVTPTNTIHVDDQAEWVSNSPSDGSSVGTGSQFQVTWVIKNSGKTTWTPAYAFRFYAGERMGGQNIQVSENVKPGEEAQLTVSMVAPSTAGKYNGIWVLTNDQGINFYSVTINIKSVSQTPTVTPATPTETDTPEPTSTSAVEPTSATVQPTSQ